MDPYLTHLYRVGFDGKGLQLLTPENANHTVSFSADGKFFVDSYSRVDLPGQSVLRRADNGAEVKVLEKADFSELMQANWKFPEPFQGKALDGTTDIYGLIWRPSNFDASKKYPIVEHVYIGPQGFFVPKTIAASLRLQSVAELGFIVVMVDGRGTAGRSRAFHNFSYHNLGGRLRSRCLDQANGCTLSIWTSPALASSVPQPGDTALPARYWCTPSSTKFVFPSLEITTLAWTKPGGMRPIKATRSGMTTWHSPM